MQDKKNLNYKRSIKLGPAIGDWTKIKLQDLNLEEVAISSIKDIGFDSLPQEQLKYTHYLHYRLAESIVKKLSHDMNVKVELHTIKVAQVPYETFLESQTKKVVQTDFILPNIGRVNCLLEWELADMIVNRLSGGDCEINDVDNFSELEITMLQEQIKEILPYFSNVWKKTFNPELINMEFTCGNYVHDRKISLREAYVYYKFQFYFGKSELRNIVWAYPNNVLRKLINLKQQIPDPLKKRILLTNKTLSKSTVDISAILGSTTITMADIQALQVGDVITLNSKVNSPVFINVGNKAKLAAQPGFLNNKLAVQIINEENEDLQLEQNEFIESEEAVNDYDQEESNEITANEENYPPADFEELASEDEYIEENINEIETSEEEPEIEEAAEENAEYYEENPLEENLNETENWSEETEDVNEEDFNEESIEEETEDFESINSDDDEDTDDDDFSWDDLDDDNT